MNIIRSINDIFKKLNYVLEKDEKLIGIGVLFLTFIESLTELVGVSVIVPLIQAFVDIDLLIEAELSQKVIKMFNIQSNEMFVVLLFSVVGIVFVAKNALAIFTKYVSIRFSCKVTRGLSTRMMQAYMEREYSFFVSTNVSEIYRGMNTDTVRVYELLNSGIQFIKSCMMIGVLFMYLLFTSWWMTLIIILIALLFFVLIFRSFRRVVVESGEKNRLYSSLSVKNVLESFAGIKEILVLNCQQYFVRKYKKTYTEIQRTQIRKTMAEGVPTHILEMILVTVVMVVMSLLYLNLKDLSSIVPTLVAFAYACTRIMPLLGGVAGTANAITFQRISLNAVYDEFEKLRVASEREQVQIREADGSGISFNSKMEFKNIHFAYEGSTKPVLEDLDLTIHKGESIAFIGKSGAGKSTLVDIILGLFMPQQGDIYIDGINVTGCNFGWCNLVGYVPQANYLLDDTIRRNIAFGVEEDKIDEARLWQAITKAQLKEHIDSLPEGIDTVVGERGVRLSGGQRQRIVIARALYNNPAILILDEATSALDAETEAAVVSSLDKLKEELTLIVVAHRLSTIKDCDHIYEIVDGRAVEVDKNQLFA